MRNIMQVFKFILSQNYNYFKLISYSFVILFLFTAIEQIKGSN